MEIVAIIAAHNEEDIISDVVGELIFQGIQVYLIDHQSKDQTVNEARKWLGRGLIHIESFPEDSNYPEENKQRYIWSDILRRKEELAQKLNADWIIHSDADELREAPFPMLRLSEGIKLVNALGFNAINFSVFNFRPVDNSFIKDGSLKNLFSYYESGKLFDAIQVRAWKKTGVEIDLCSSGGHDVCFPGRRVFPINFILRHYPIRSIEHGKRKIFVDRKPRYDSLEKSKGWHKQYNKIVLEEDINFNKNDLKSYNKWNVLCKIIRDSAWYNGMKLKRFLKKIKYCKKIKT